MGNLVVIGSSCGGHRILDEIFSLMPSLDAAVVIVQHMPDFINNSTRKRLDRVTDMHVEVAVHGRQIEHGTVLIAPSEIHLMITEDRSICLVDGEKVCFAKPSVDIAMMSLNRQPGETLVGIVLTGMGNDGTEGIMHIKRDGGTTIAQESSSCVVDGMPKSAIETGCVDLVLSPAQIKAQLVELFGSSG